MVRFLLGATETGFFPGIILFLTYWFPAEYRARMVGRFMAAIPISTVTGAPVSGLILGMDGIWGLRGWQWLFICEGLPTGLLGLVVIFYLTDGPEEASWLQADERDWLIDGNALVVTAPPGPAYRPFRHRHRRFVEPCR